MRVNCSEEFYLKLKNVNVWFNSFEFIFMLKFDSNSTQISSSAKLDKNQSIKLRPHQIISSSNSFQQPKSSQNWVLSKYVKTVLSPETSQNSSQKPYWNCIYVYFARSTRSQLTQSLTRLNSYRLTLYLEHSLSCTSSTGVRPQLSCATVVHATPEVQLLHLSQAPPSPATRYCHFKITRLSSTSTSFFAFQVTF